ncbi:pyridoxal phosphate-dependent aminotransferase [Ideonella sp. 4Y16]|uniref:pyridoxal phosphate-dependent aminotransferase n=1 Tax=Ideonella alba TaxID=2824118 RepID=UPI001B35A421|nr:pyridoxal phosphate-dependent aminotransferase [Ideonella alba]MBQ0943312.1 pyridoxal phosphate-dependent aminotransferase [Ideonella alba]
MLPYPTAARVDAIDPFHAMALFRRADALAAEGRPIIQMSVGEPDFTAPPAVVEALNRAVAEGRTRYTSYSGITPLREAISAHYRRVHGLDVPASRILVTAGASGALQLACALLVGVGDEVLMPDPTYPCNRHFVSAFDGTTRLIPAGPGQRFQLDGDDVRAHWGPRTRGVMLASPSNPTGTTIAPEALQRVLDAVRERRGFLVFDEIYNQLTYGGPTPRSALALGDDVIVINSFSKYFCMTGWRLGWLVLPEALVPQAEKLAMNLFICPPATAQYAALGCFEPESLAIYEQRRQAFAQRRDYVVPALRAMGFEIPTEPDGAFYVYADVSRWGLSGEVFANRLLDEAGVCVVPGLDFGVHERDRWVRFTYATGMERLQEAMRRIAAFTSALR